MKKLLTTILMLTAMNGFAGTKKVEFDENQERACYGEAEKLGCIKNDQENKSCMEKKKSSLSATCRSIYEAKKAQ